MQAVAEQKNLDIFTSNKGLVTLYTSSNNGQTFDAAVGSDGKTAVPDPILSATFSEKCVPKDATDWKTIQNGGCQGGDSNPMYPAFATVEDGHNKYMYVSSKRSAVDGKSRVWDKYPTTYKNGDKKVAVHFDYVVPHPWAHDRFMGLDVDANGKTFTVYLCDNVFAVSPPACVQGSQFVKDAQWIQANKHTRWMNKQFGIYLTKYASKAEADSGTGNLNLFEWHGVTGQSNGLSAKLNTAGPIANFEQHNA